MKPLICSSEALKLDRSALALSDGEWLMERASYLMFQELRARFPAEKSILALCGNGNNGGDAASIAISYAALTDARVTVIKLPGKPREAVARRFTRLEAAGATVCEWGDEKASVALRSATTILDGLSGVGLQGAFRDRDIVGAVNGLGTARIVAIDVPSGVRNDPEPHDPIIEADMTLCVAPLKSALYHPRARSAAGTIVPIDGVFPPRLPFEANAFLLEERDVGELSTALRDDAHKGSRGRLAIFAGGEGTVGAARISARSAFRAGLVRLFVDEGTYPILASSLDSAMVERGFDRFSAPDFDAILIGPGYRGAPFEAERYADTVSSGKPCVVDAGALDHAARTGLFPRVGILTPHPGEYARLTGIDKDLVLSSPMGYLSKTARETSCVVVLKSHVTWIAAPDGRLRACDGMLGELAVGGSGDALAGMIAGYLAGGLDPFDAASVGVVLHRHAGKVAAEQEGFFEASSLARYGAFLGHRALARGER
jgi:NAD(P)H-hydrate epimerase